MANTPQRYLEKIREAKEKQLKKLDLSNDWFTDDKEELTEIPAEVFELEWLEVLNLSFNQLTTLPEAIANLQQLTTLDLSRNKLTRLPEVIARLQQLTTLDLSFNPIEKPPPEIVEQGIEAIRDYFRQLQAEGIDYLYEAKLLIVGEGEAGKTTLAKKIEDQNYQLQEEDSTKGIEVIQWGFPMENGREFRVNIWDFGGQEIYHATHQFFLTKRSLYALVADNRREDTNFYYWLNVVELLSDNSPVLIIKNQKGDRVREINELQLRGQFNNLKEILATNLSTNQGLPEILGEIKYRMTSLDMFGTELPKTWVKVREALEKDPRDYISLDEYLQICQDNDFTQQEDNLQLSGYLHDLGVCLHFQADPILYNTLILKPKWGTDAVYRVLNNKQVINNSGRFTWKNLQNIWHEKQYARKQGELLQLMINFKLCYEIPRSPRTYIAPQLLTEKQPEYEWNETNNLILRYTYEFMPKGIITQFIVAMHELINAQQFVWKSGIILSEDETEAEVIEYYDLREIKIRIIGRDKRDLMTRVTYELDKIHASYKRLKYNKLIPCNCNTCKNSQEPHFYKLENLRNRLAKQKYDVECDISFEKVNVLSLIDDVIDKDRLLVEQLGVEVFISYSHQDQEWLTKLQKHLKPIIRNQNLLVWDDTKIQAGAEWRKEIENALAAAKIAVLLVSPNFLASDFIHENELPPLLNAAQGKGLTIIWIPLSSSSYEETEIEKYQSAHPPNQPLDSLNPSEENKAWVNICKKIKAAAIPQ